jgi:hypothetical protein
MGVAKYDAAAAGGKSGARIFKHSIRFDWRDSGALQTASSARKNPRSTATTAKSKCHPPSYKCRPIRQLFSSQHRPFLIQHAKISIVYPSVDGVLVSGHRITHPCNAPAHGEITNVEGYVASTRSKKRRNNPEIVSPQRYQSPSV